MSETKEMVNHPSHYGGADNVYEVIKIIDAYKLNFDLGNVIKYVLRAGEKDDIIQDLEKAKWYLQHEIDLIKKENQEIKTVLAKAIDKEIEDFITSDNTFDKQEIPEIKGNNVKKAKTVLNENTVKTLV